MVLPGDAMKSVLLATITMFSIHVGTAQTESLWNEISATSIVQVGQPFEFPANRRTYSLSFNGMRSALQSAPLERTPAAETNPLVLSIPSPDSRFQRFAVVEVQIMEPGLAAQFPEIRTYAGQGIDEPTTTIRLDVTMAGFHAMVRSTDGDYFIDPHNRGDLEHYVLYSKQGVVPSSEWSCTLIADPAISEEIRRLAASRLLTPTGPQLRTYRLACAATVEYTAFFGGTVALGQAAIVTAINRVSGVYETELAVRMVLVANNSSVVYAVAPDPFSNGNGSTMLGQNQTNMTNIIGGANYDIGHVFSTGGGGVAGLGVVCNASNKARGVTGSGSPTGDPFWIDYVAHEMGHQFGGNHTFNSTTSSCGGGNRNGSTAYEPGSGSTIMAYAGICGADDLQPNSDAFFHVGSFDEIVAFTNSGGGNSCPVTTSTGNNAPVVNAGTGGFVIPISTPFVLTGSATDPNSDAMTYSWEEFDTGPAGSPNSPSGNAPIFRSFSPVASATRIFPKQSNLLNNTSTIGEILPTYTRSLKFRLVVRDNRSGGGGVDYDTLAFGVTSTAGPFLVTAPNTAVSWAGISTQAVTWNVANTSSSPVSCANVNILLSTDGGVTFPTTLVSNTPNDGSQTVTVPNTPTTTARMKVEAVGNIFFDISNTNFTITAPVLAAPAPVFPSDNVTQQPVSLTIRWNTVATALTYRLQVGTDSTFAGGLVVNDSTLTDTLLLVSGMNINTKYFWRVNAKNGATTSSFSSLRRFTTIAPPAAAALVSPADNVTGQDTSLTIRWNTTATATSYRLQLSSDSTFVGGLVVNDSTLIDTSFVVGGLSYNTRYFWRVRGQNAAGNGASSVLRRFTTLAPPVAPLLVSPSDNVIGLPDSLVLVWRTAAVATTYRLQLSSDSTFVSGFVVDDSTLTDTSAIANPLVYSTQYFWRVNGKNVAGTGAWSSIRRFTTLAPPAAPTLVSPADNAVNQSLALTLAWNNVPVAATYTLEVSTDSTFAGGQVFLDSTLVDTTQLLSGLAIDTQHFWRVKGQNEAGIGPWSNSRRFTTIALPAATTLVMPADNSIEQSLSPVLVWNMIANASNYFLQLSTDSTFSGSLIVNDSTLTDTAYAASGLVANTEHYWRVRTSNEAGNSGWSAQWRFTTIPAPAAVVLISPLNDVEIPIDSVEVVWEQSAPAVTSYWLEWSTDSLFTASFVDSTIADTTSVISDLQDNATFYWRVRAYNAAGWGAFSDVRRFTTLFQVQVCIPLQSSWNLVSLPVGLANDSSHVVFPVCGPTCPFQFIPGSGYQESCTVEPGKGYWVKCSSGANCVTGVPIERDTIEVVQGWNLVGAISTPVSASSIVTDPPDIIQSTFYRFVNGYESSETLDPGVAYWVKVSQAGAIILDSGAAPATVVTGAPLKR